MQYVVEIMIQLMLVNALYFLLHSQAQNVTCLNISTLALCRTIDHPSLFLTMTTNTKWPEIQEMMKHLPGVDVADAPDVVAHVFKLKLEQLIDLIKKIHFFGHCIGCKFSQSFQKYTPLIFTALLDQS